MTQVEQIAVTALERIRANGFRLGDAVGGGYRGDAEIADEALREIGRLMKRKARISKADEAHDPLLRMTNGHH